MFRREFVAALAVILAGLSGPAAAQEAPAAAEAAVKVTVVSVKGDAEKRFAADAEGKWEAIKAGDVLDELTMIRTGLGAEVVLRFSDRGDVTVRNATKMGIKEFSKKGEVVTTRLGVKYGSMRAQVDTTRGTNDFEVATPVAVLGIPGTGGSLGFSGDFGTYMRGTQGTWSVTGSGGRTMNVGAGEQTDGDLTGSGDLAAGNRDTQMGDPNGGTTGNEQNHLINNGSGLGIIDFAGTGTTTTNLRGTLSSMPKFNGEQNDYKNGYEFPTDFGN